MTQPRPETRPPDLAPPAAAPAIPVTIPAPLRSLAGGAAEVPVHADTVGEALDAVLDRHPGLRRHFRTEAGALREHINVFVNEEDIRVLEGEATRVSVPDVVIIVPSIAGG